MQTMTALVCIALLTCGSSAESLTYERISAFDVRSMRVGGRLLKLTENRQLTLRCQGIASCPLMSPDGTYVAYNSRTRSRVDHACIVSTSGGPPRVVFPRAMSEEDRAQHDKWEYFGEMAWSPASDLLVLYIAKLATTAGVDGERALAVFGTDGVERMRFAMPSGLSICGLGPGMVWRPDGLQFAAVATSTSHRDRVMIFDCKDKSARTAYSLPNKGSIHLDSWMADGLRLTAIDYPDDIQRRRDVTIRGECVESTESKYLRRPSPDGRFCLASLCDVEREETDPEPLWCDDDDGLRPNAPDTIVSCATGKRVTDSIVRGAGIHWAPNSLTLACLWDDLVYSDPVFACLRSIWLMAPERNVKPMCVAVDVSEHDPISWSADSLKIAYIRDDCVYVAELAWESDGD